MGANNLVEISNLTFCRERKVIFDNISLTVPIGKVTAIMGPSGIGKTTLLRLIGGQLLPESGIVKFADQDITTLSRRKLYEVRKRMSMLFQSGALFTDMTVFDNVAFPLREHTYLTESLIKTLVLLKLESVGLRGASQLMPSTLSGGMARRVALARAIALDPELIMFDEPFVGQDPITMGVLVSLIRNLNEALGLTSIVVSHDVPEVMSIADHVYLLVDGSIVASGVPQSICDNPDPRVIQFLRGDADGPVPFKYPAKDIIQELFS
ncbi:phospholipid ABC transporter ATP-binding protein MlaF [Candidatus Enterovibrio escicola]|uniref:Putative ABC transporter, ATP-binding protein YrbF n=1 Tax=Candidatus Enterovibrio escicola TaxID=1927127 RepID=A0A2A5T596_9GAMM|nr:phospholipid ABC transporter ATP-binding protein MlaF [Candidatus Enterovibrio escacola]PCS23337.1 putative ABC transporter, ATP-binding protein YrbF [Candidatus Enterovibrio escacola]